MNKRISRLGAGIVGIVLMVGAVPMAFAEGPAKDDNIARATSPYAPVVRADTWSSSGFTTAALTDGVKNPTELASDGNEEQYWASAGVGSSDITLTWTTPHVLAKVAIVGWQPDVFEQVYFGNVSAPVSASLQYTDVRTGASHTATANCAGTSTGAGTTTCTLTPGVMTNTLTVTMSNGTIDRHVGVTELSVYAGAIDASGIVVDPIAVAWRAPITLPQYLDVPLVGGGRVWAPVAWDATPFSGSPATPGRTIYHGHLDGVADPVSLVVNVADAVVAVPAVSVATVVGVAPTLPDLVDGTLASGGSVAVRVTWASIAPANYATVGTFTVSGSYLDPVAAGAAAGAITATVVVGAPPGPVPTNEPTIRIDVPTGADGLPQLHLGEAFRLIGSNLPANTSFEVWMLSTPIQLGATASDDNGAFSQDFRVPGDVEFGKHRIQIRTGGTVVAEAWFDLVGDGTGVGGHNATRAKAAVAGTPTELSSRRAMLPRTGTDVLPIAIVAGGFVVVGLVVFVTRRRSRSA